MSILNFLNINKPKSCQLCRKPAKDIMTDGFNDKNQTYYCREHLIEIFGQKFCSYPDLIVVCPPRTDGTYGSLYPFYPLIEFKKYNFSEGHKKSIKELINQIPANRCAICREMASVRYFPNPLYGRSTPGSSSIFLCKNDAFKKIKEPLLNNPRNFDEWGIIPPYGGEGIYVSTDL